MNILYYDRRKIRLPDYDDSDKSDGENDHFISIGVNNKKKRQMIDIYVSLIIDIQSKMIIQINQQ